MRKVAFGGANSLDNFIARQDNRSIAAVAAMFSHLRLATNGIQALKHVQKARGKGDHLQSEYLALLRDRQGGSKRQVGQETTDETPNV